MNLKPKSWQRVIDLPNGSRALQWIWPASSDDRPGHGVTAWAVLETTYDVNLRQFIVRARRMFTRKTGEVRERYGAEVPLRGYSVPGRGADDTHAESESLVRATARIPEEIRTGATALAKIFPPGDVLL